MIDPREVLLGLFILASACRDSAAAVSPAEAERLKGDLTPLGAERAGNASGTIPAWEGGYTQVWPGYQSGQPRPDPFASEKPLYRIDADNMATHAAELTEGIRALLGAFLDATRRLPHPPHGRRAGLGLREHVQERHPRAHRRRRPRRAGRVRRDPFPPPEDWRRGDVEPPPRLEGRGGSYEYGTYVVASGSPSSRARA